MKIKDLKHLLTSLPEEMEVFVSGANENGDVSIIIDNFTQIVNGKKAFVLIIPPPNE